MKSETTFPHHRFDTSQLSYLSPQALQQLTGWALTLVAVIIGFTYAAPLVAPVLENLYELLVQKNVFGL